MRDMQNIMVLTMALGLGTGSLAVAQVPSAGDMQQKLDQEMMGAKRTASESASATRQEAGSMKSDAERKVEQTATEHKSQAEGKMSEAIEKAKRKSQGLDR